MHIFIALCLVALQPTSLWGRSVAHKAHKGHEVHAAHESHGAWGSSSESVETSAASSRDNIAELLLPLIEQGLSAEHRPNHSKKVIQVLPISNSQEHSASWPNLNTRKKHVVEITPLRGKGRDGQPLAYILSPAKPKRRSRKRLNKHHNSHELHNSHEQHNTDELHDTHEHHDTHDNQDTHEHLDTSEHLDTHDNQDTREHLDTHEHQDTREHLDTHEHQDIREHLDTHEHQDTREHLDTHEHQDTREHHDTHEHRFSQEHYDNDNPDHHDSHEHLITHEHRDSQEHYDTREHHAGQEHHNSPEKHLENPSKDFNLSTIHKDFVGSPDVYSESISSERVLMEPSLEHSDSISRKRVEAQSSEEHSESISYEEQSVQASAEPSESISEEDIIPSEGYIQHKEHNDHDEEQTSKEKAKPIFHEGILEQPSEEHSESISQEITVELLNEDNRLISSKHQIVKEEKTAVFSDPLMNTVVEPIDDENVTDQNNGVVAVPFDEHIKQDVKEAAVVSSENPENTPKQSIIDEYIRDVSDRDINITGLKIPQNVDSAEGFFLDEIVSRENSDITSSEPSQESDVEINDKYMSNPYESNQSKEPYDNHSNSKSEDTIIERPLGDKEYSKNLNTVHLETNKKHDYSNKHVDYSKKPLATELESLDVLNHYDDHTNIGSSIISFSGLGKNKNHPVSKDMHTGNNVINSNELNVPKSLDNAVIQPHTKHEQYDHNNNNRNPEKVTQSKVNADKNQIELSAGIITSYDRDIERDRDLPNTGHHDENVKINHRHPHNKKEIQFVKNNLDNHLDVIKSTDNIQTPMVEITVLQSEKPQKIASENSEDSNLVQSDHHKNIPTIVSGSTQPASSAETERDVVIAHNREGFNEIWEPHSTDVIELIQSSSERSDADKGHGPCHDERQRGNAQVHQHKSYRLSFLFNKK